MASVQIKRGTRAQIEAAKTANGLLNGEPYLITDESRLAVGTATNAYSDCAKKSEVDGKEPALGNPASDGKVLSSTAAGVRSWVDRGGSPGLVLLATATASNVTSVDFTSGIDSTYDEYEIHLINVTPVTDDVAFWLRTSSNSGSSFDSGSTDYTHGLGYARADTYSVDSASYSTGAAQIVLSGGFNLQTDVSGSTGLSGVIRINRPSVAQYFRIMIDAVTSRSAGEDVRLFGVGTRKAASVVNAIRFLFSSGNIASGKFKLYGLRKTV